MQPLQDQLTSFLRSEFGILGTVVVAVVSLAIWLWTKWNDIRTWPFVEPALSSLYRLQPLPRATASRFTIAIADFVGDQKREAKQLVIDDVQDFEGIAALPIRRAISDRNVPAAHERAHRLLQITGANVLLWGRVLTYDGRNRIRLYWTTSSGQIELAHKPKRYAFTEDLTLPDLFWQDVMVVLNVLVSSMSAEMRRAFGSHGATQIPALVERLQKLIDDGGDRWPASSLIPLKILLADSYFWLSEETGNQDGFQRAIETARAALPQLQPFSAEWAKLQLTYSTALARIGERTGDNELLEESLAAQEEILTDEIRTRAPLLWEMAQGDRAATLQLLGDRTGRSDFLARAVESYRSVIDAQRNRGAETSCALTLHNLGGALHQLGRRANNEPLLLEAIDTFQRALEVRTQNRFPVYWALTTYNLANSLGDLARVRNDDALAHDAIELYRAAIEEIPKWRLPLEWAMVQAGLGRAQRRLGELKQDLSLIRAAEKALRAAASDQTRALSPLMWAEAMGSLASATCLIGYMERNPEAIMEGVHLYDESIAAQKPESVPFVWAMSKRNQAQAYRLLSEVSGDLKFLDSSIPLFKEALTVYSPSIAWRDWMGTVTLLGHVLAALGLGRGDPAMLRSAIELFRSVMLERSGHSENWDWRSVKLDLANATLQLANLEPTSEHIEAAANAAVDVYKESDSGITLYTADGQMITLRPPPAN